MKTTIDLTQYDFKSRIFTQISDCPDSGFVRVLVYTGDNYQEKIKRWFLNAEIWYINPTNNKLFSIELAKSKGQDWVISNEYKVTVFNTQNQPIPNPNFNLEEEINYENLPFLVQNAFDRFSEFRVGNYNLPMKTLWEISVKSDDNNGYFDKKENYKSLVDIQKEYYQ